MILADTSVWAGHFRHGDAVLIEYLERQLVLLHPFVIGELALGYLKPRAAVLRDLKAAPQALVALEEDVLNLVETEKLIGIGIGYVDAHLLASVRLGDGIALWTRDKRLRTAAQNMGLAFESA